MDTVSAHQGGAHNRTQVKHTSIIKKEETEIKKANTNRQTVKDKK